MINVSLYLMFVMTSFLVVITPGPAVLVSITSVLRHGFKNGFWTVFGVACGTVIMAFISSSGLGIIIATSPKLYKLIQAIGACYIAYLGLRLCRAQAFTFVFVDQGNIQTISSMQKVGLWLQGVAFQMANPMLVMFFISLFPQFIDAKLSLTFQMTLLSLTHFILVLFVHCGYGFIATHFRYLLKNKKVALCFNRFSGTLFLVLSMKILVDLLST